MAGGKNDTSEMLAFMLACAFVWLVFGVRLAWGGLRRIRAAADKTQGKAASVSVPPAAVSTLGYYRFCAKCGERLPADNVFCGACGTIAAYPPTSHS